MQTGYLIANALITVVGMLVIGIIAYNCGHRNGRNAVIPKDWFADKDLQQGHSSMAEYPGKLRVERIGRIVMVCFRQKS